MGGDIQIISNNNIRIVILYIYISKVKSRRCMLLYKNNVVVCKQ